MCPPQNNQGKGSSIAINANLNNDGDVTNYWNVLNPTINANDVDRDWNVPPLHGDWIVVKRKPWSNTNKKNHNGEKVTGDNKKVNMKEEKNPTTLGTPTVVACEDKISSKSEIKKKYGTYVGQVASIT